jgi:glutathione S-transferase
MLAFPVRTAIARMYDVRSPSARALPDLIRSAADLVERQLAPGSHHLLEDQLTLADITVASLLGPVVGPPGSPWSFDLAIPEFQSLRAEFRARPAGSYVTQLYAARPVPA